MNNYPWINFTLDLRQLPVQTWLQLGECVSKIEHISRIPLRPAIAKEMHNVYLAKGVQATTAIEGNTLTEEQVKLRIDHKLELPPSKEYLGQEVDNIIRLCNETRDSIIKGEEFKIGIDKICYYNKIILQNVPLQEHVVPGQFRQCSVGVGSYRAPDCQDVPALTEKFCTWLNEEITIDKNLPIVTSIIKAIIAHLYIAWIHPFGDGNGRTARILEFAILLNSGVPTPAAHLLSNHYNSTRTEYYRQLDMASKKQSITDFISYAIQGFRDGLQEQLNYIFTQVIDMAWESHIYETFRTYKHSEVTTKRRRRLVLEISKQPSPVLIPKLITLSAGTIEDYRDKGLRTFLRDVAELVKLDLIEEVESGYQAKKQKILEFLPLRSELK